MPNKRTQGIPRCRLCLISTENATNAILHSNICKKLNTFCNINISEDETLPSFICFTCLNEVNRFSDFYNRIQENQKLLLETLNQKEESSIEDIADSTKQETSLPNPTIADIEIKDTRNEKSTNIDLWSVEETDKNSNEPHGSIEIEISEENYDNTSCIDDLNDTNQEVANADVNIQEEENSEFDFSSIPHLDSVKLTKFQKWCQNQLKIKNNDEKKSQLLILPPQKSKHRIILDAPIREFFDLICLHCNYIFLTFATMKSHMRTKHGEDGFVLCCNKKFNRREAIMEHISFHLNPNQFICPTCQQVCKSKVTLKIHMKQHMPEEDRAFRCSQCHQSFVLNSQLKSHEKSHFTDTEKKYTCEECGKAFAFRFVLEKHKQYVHIKERNFMCEICARSFVDAVNLSAHRKTHDSIKERLKCPKCDTLLKNKVTLKIHLRGHEKSEYQCDQCKKVLATKNALLNHVQYVHKNKQYPCEVCQKVFKKSLTLKEHMALHNGVKLYKCDYCDKTFNAKANVYGHVKKIHREEWEKQQQFKWGKVPKQNTKNSPNRM